MWHALKAELDYFRSWLVGAVGLGVGVAALVSGIFWAVGEEGPPSYVAAGIRGMFLILAPLILGFVIQALRNEERRTRLLMATPLTPRQLAWVAVLIPVVLFAIGILCAALALVLDFLVTGSLALESVHVVGFVGGMLLMGAMIGLLVQEATRTYRQGRSRAAVAGWAVVALGILVLAAMLTAAAVFQGPGSWPMLHAGNLIVAVAAMVTTVILHTGRIDFTK